jgi:hypothetical protein
MAGIRDSIRERAEAGDPLDAIERELENVELDDDERSALWLYAWHYSSGGEQEGLRMARPVTDTALALSRN